MNNTHESYWREFWSCWSSWSPRTLTWSWPGALATNKHQSRDLMGSLSLLFCDGTKWSGEAPWTPPPGLLSRLGLGAGHLDPWETWAQKVEEKGTAGILHLLPRSGFLPGLQTRCRRGCMWSWRGVSWPVIFLGFGFLLGASSRKWDDKQMRIWNGSLETPKLYCYSLLTRVRVPSWWHERVRARAVASDCLQPHELRPAKPLYPWNFPGKNTVSFSFSRGLPWPRDWTHISYVSWTGRQVLYQLSHQGRWWKVREGKRLRQRSPNLVKRHHCLDAGPEAKRYPEISRCPHHTSSSSRPWFHLILCQGPWGTPNHQLCPSPRWAVYNSQKTVFLTHKV